MLEWLEAIWRWLSKGDTFDAIVTGAVATAIIALLADLNLELRRNYPCKSR